MYLARAPSVAKKQPEPACTKVECDRQMTTSAIVYKKKIVRLGDGRLGLGNFCEILETQVRRVRRREPSSAYLHYILPSRGKVAFGRPCPRYL
jgi:hypothetical protein